MIFSLDDLYCFLFLFQTKPIALKGIKSVSFYEYHNDYLSTILVKNERDEDVVVELNCEDSKNSISNQVTSKTSNVLHPKVRIPAKKTKIGIHLMASNENKDWLFSSKISISK
jgi:hypothetical protein